MLNKLKAYITNFAGEKLGFHENIRQLNLRIINLEDDKRVMHDNYMDKYREIEREISDIMKHVHRIEFPMEIRHLLSRAPIMEYNTMTPRLMMATMDMNLSEQISPVQRERIILANMSMGFKAEFPKQREGKDLNLVIAIGFARKAADLAYEEIMTKLGHHPTNKQKA